MASRSSTFQLSWTWSAVIAGVFASLVFQILYTMLGFGVGLLAIDIPTGANAPAAVGYMAFAWWAFTGVLAAFVGGAVAASLAPEDTAQSRISHALASWAVTTVIVVGASGLTAGTAGNIVGNLTGPSYQASQRLDFYTSRQNRPAGQAAPTQAQVEQARRHFAYVMLASFVMLMVGAGAAYGAGATIEQRTARKIASAAT